MAEAELPPVRGFVRGKSGLRAFRVPAVRGECAGFEYCAQIPAWEDHNAKCAYSGDGHFLAVQTEENVGVYEVDVAGELNQVQAIEMANVLGVQLSPSGAYLVCWTRFLGKEPNLMSYDVRTGEQISSVVSRESPRDIWPVMFWSADEQVVARARTNEIQLNAGRPSNTPDARIRVENVTSCSVAPGRPPYKIASFSAPNKALPAFVKVHSFNSLDEVGLDLAHTASTSFFRAETCEFLWQPNGKTVIAKAQCASDAQDKSYYGECQLYYLQADGKHTNQIQLDKEGPVHDVKWAPSGADFVVLYGFMPGKCTLFGEKCHPKFEFGNVALNTAFWSPHGRFLALGGFGSLNGDLEFWDMNKTKKIGHTNARYSVDCVWSPDSRHFATAVTAPRRRTDFCVKMFSYHGLLEHEEETEELYQLAWAPCPRGVYPDRPASPGRAGAMNETAVAPAAKYVPPSARGKGGEANALKVREALDAARGTGASSAGPRKVKKDSAVPLSKAAIKNQKKREAKKKAEEAAEAEGIDLKALRKAQEAAPAPPEAAPAEPEAPVDPEVAKQKQIRNLQKKLRQITDLKDKQAGGVELNPEQLKKLSSEGGLLQDLEALMR